MEGKIWNFFRINIKAIINLIAFSIGGIPATYNIKTKLLHSLLLRDFLQRDTYCLSINFSKNLQQVVNQ
jgi:hypothetical protein